MADADKVVVMGYEEDMVLRGDRQGLPRLSVSSTHVIGRLAAVVRRRRAGPTGGAGNTVASWPALAVCGESDLDLERREAGNTRRPTSLAGARRSAGHQMVVWTLRQTLAGGLMSRRQPSQRIAQSVRAHSPTPQFGFGRAIFTRAARSEKVREDVRLDPQRPSLEAARARIVFE